MSTRTRRVAAAAVTCAVVVPLTLALGALPDDRDAGPAEPAVTGPVDPASGDVSAFPAPGVATAWPTTQISFRGVDAAALGTVRVEGDRSGLHTTSTLEHSDGQGVSLVPDDAFLPGEVVTVTTDHAVRGAVGGSFSFTVAVPVPRPPMGAPPVEPQGPDVPVRRYTSAPGLQPPVVEIHTPAPDGAGEGSDASPPGASDTGRPGYVVIGVKNGYAQKGPMLVDDSGEPVWFHPLRGVDARDVSVQSYGGEPVLSWWEGRQPVGFGYGEVVLLDEGYSEVARFGMGNGFDPDSHEVLLTPEGTALLIGYETVEMDLSPLGGPADGRVMDNIVQEVDIETGAVLFEWHTLGSVALSESYLPADDGLYDYAHLNSVDVDDDGDLLVSARHTCAVYKVDRETASVIWRLGGRESDFTLGDGALFLKQHDARRSQDGTVTLFDNGGECGEEKRESSRGIALELDEEAMTAELVREHVHPDELFAESQGSYQELADGEVLLGWGSLPRWSQMTADGEMVLDATIPDELIITSYRARRAPWTGTPSTEPSAVLTGTAEEGAVLHASWNGATEVAAWRVSHAPAGDAADPGSEPAVLATARRTGFETAVRLPAGALPATAAGTTSPLLVEALDAGGAVLGTTRPVAPLPVWLPPELVAD